MGDQAIQKYSEDLLQLYHFTKIIVFLWACLYLQSWLGKKDLKLQRTRVVLKHLVLLS